MRKFSRFNLQYRHSSYSYKKSHSPNAIPFAFRRGKRRAMGSGAGGSDGLVTTIRVNICVRKTTKPNYLLFVKVNKFISITIFYCDSANSFVAAWIHDSSIGLFVNWICRVFFFHSCFGEKYNIQNSWRRVCVAGECLSSGSTNLFFLQIKIVRRRLAENDSID